MNKLCVFFLLLLSLKTSGQKHDYQWLLGFDRSSSPIIEGVGLVKFDFLQANSPKIEKLPKFDGYFFNSNTSVSDFEGHLQAYSNGTRVFGPNHLLMKNGDTLILPPDYTKTGATAMQGALMLPHPAQDSLYLLFTKQEAILPPTWVASTKLYCSILDMRPNNGNGAVPQKRNVVIADTIEYGHITAVRHANGRGWWMLQPEENSNRFYKVLVDTHGPRLNGSQTVGEAVESGIGQVTFTPDGSKYIRARSVRAGVPARVDIYDFDRCTGRLSNQRFLLFDEPGHGIGVSCSPDSRHLYVIRTFNAYQYDLWAPDLEASKVLVGVYDGFRSAFDVPDYFWLSQLAPDGRIYVGTVNTGYHLSYIKHPARRGLACGFVPHGVFLQVLNHGSVPNHPNYRLGPLDGSPCDTLGLDNHPLANFRWEHEDSTELLRVTFTDLSAYEPESWQWDFGDGTGSTERYPVHDYAQNGVYTACLIVKNRFSADTFCQKVYLGVSAQDNPDLQSRIEVWPNPMEDRLVLALSTPELGRPLFRLFDATGRLVREERVEYGLNEIDVSDLGKGLYFWAVERDGVRVGDPHERVKSGKVVKM